MDSNALAPDYDLVRHAETASGYMQATAACVALLTRLEELVSCYEGVPVQSILLSTPVDEEARERFISQALLRWPGPLRERGKPELQRQKLRDELEKHDPETQRAMVLGLNEALYEAAQKFARNTHPVLPSQLPETVQSAVETLCLAVADILDTRPVVLPQESSDAEMPNMLEALTPAHSKVLGSPPFGALHKQARIACAVLEDAGIAHLSQAKGEEPQDAVLVRIGECASEVVRLLEENYGVLRRCFSAARNRPTVVGSPQR